MSSVAFARTAVDPVNGGADPATSGGITWQPKGEIHVERVQVIRLQGQCLRPGGRRHHRRGLQPDRRRHRQPADHADHRRAHRRAQLRQLFPAAVVNVTATTLAEAQKQGAVLGYGAFITIVVNFLIVAFVLFQLVKVVEPHEEGGAAAAARRPDRSRKSCWPKSAMR